MNNNIMFKFKTFNHYDLQRNASLQNTMFTRFLLLYREISFSDKSLFENIHTGHLMEQLIKRPIQIYYKL